jgi:hypothetical protein
MPSTVTVTAKVGPALQATAVPISSVNVMSLDLNKRVIQLDNGTPLIKEFDLVGVTTMTVAISGANYTVALS